MGITVEKPGFLTTIQDAGRFGYQQNGVSPAGPMDLRSFHLANILVGNDRGEGVLEMTFSGPALRFGRDIIIAVTGAEMDPKINGNPVPMYQACLIHAGETLTFGTVTGNGIRGYIAFAGGLEVPLVMGSKSTLTRNHIGGIDGRKLEQEDVIPFCYPVTKLPRFEKRKLIRDVFPKKELTLRVVRGPQDYEFEEEEIRKFFWYGSEITNEFDRMGCRLYREIPVKHKGDGNIITDGISFGSIQIPTDGHPIIMLADRQSTGGYTKIGSVITVDIPLLAQSMSGHKVRFIEVSIELAQDLYIRYLEQLERLEKSFSQ